MCCCHSLNLFVENPKGDVEKSNLGEKTFCLSKAPIRLLK